MERNANKISNTDSGVTATPNILPNEQHHSNELIDEKVIHMIISRSEKADKYGSAVKSIKEAINRHWQELEELRRSKEREEMQNAKYLKISVKKVG